MDIIIKIIQFFLCFTILVGIHELGHFLMARVFKIRVDKFYIFFDPWFSLFKFKRGDTEYGLGWLPLGELIEMRQNKGYEDLLALRMPFLIDSAVYETASALRRGDEIVAINDAQGLEYPAYREYLKAHAGEDVTLTVKREGDMLLELVVPVSDEGRLGVTALNPYKLRTQKYTFWQAIPAGISKAGKVMSSYWEQLKMIVQPKTKMYKELGGFIAIGSIFPGDWNWEDFWMKTAFLSIILAVMNILPIPGLDGGHAIFTFWEMITGRKVSDKILEGAQYVGLFIILLLLLYANGNDIYRFFIK